MAKRSVRPVNELDRAVEALMTNRDAPLPRVSAGVRAMLEIAAELRDLPRESFKARLRSQLLAESGLAEGGKALITMEDIEQRLAELESEPKILPHNVAAAFRDLPEMSMRFITQMGDYILIASGGSSPSHWERHEGDELLYVLEGSTDIRIATGDGIKTTRLDTGSLFVCPQGFWHQLIPHGRMNAFYATPKNTEGSVTKNPPRPAKGLRKLSRKSLTPIDLITTIGKLKELKITDATTGEEANEASHNVAEMGERTLGVMRFSGLTPWERHGSDELLYALEGAVNVTVLTNSGPVHRRVNAGAFLICPENLWHRQRAEDSVTILYGTPTKRSEHSFAEDPRHQGEPSWVKS
jgi:quercetin dioxygenase-like cupin family protein